MRKLQYFEKFHYKFEDRPSGVCTMLLSFLRENVHPISYNTTLPFYPKKMDAVWSNEVWQGMSNRKMHHIHFDCAALFLHSHRRRAAGYISSKH